MYAKKNSSVKAVALLLCVALLIGGAIGGTLAYLMTSTTPVVNTFTVGNIGTLTLSETGMDATNRTKDYMVIPGVDITKDPKVTFSGNNVPAYVFLKVTATGWTVNEKAYSCVGGMVTWTVGDDWTYLATENTNEFIYVKEVAANANLNAEAIKGSSIAVDAKITKGDLNNFPTTKLEFAAYAVQKDNLATPADAWAVALHNGAPVNP